MTDQQEPRDQSTTDELAAEFENLGKNLKDAFRKLWESEGRKSLQKDLEAGLSRIGESIDQVVEELKESPTGQHLKSKAEDFQERLQKGEVGETFRSDVVKVLRKINEELEKIASQVSSKTGEE